MNKQDRVSHFEPRWPVMLTIILVLVMLALTPGRVRLVPGWFPYVIMIVVLLPIVAVWLTAAKARWLNAERIVTMIFVLVATLGTILNMAQIFYLMAYNMVEISGLKLLATSVSVWVSIVLIFSLMYWQIDRGGPEARVNRTGKMPDWLFPQEGAPAGHVQSGWHPAFVDYLFLSYSTATAFSTTDVLPITHRAKMMMMLESMMSLTTIVLIASRAINILGG